MIGGGLPVAAFGGKREIMNHIAPLGPVYQAGTLSGNPLSMASGIAMLTALESDKSFYENLGLRASKLVDGIVAEAKSNDIPMTSNYVGGMFGLFFSSEDKVTNFSQASSCDIQLFKKFYNAMLKNGIYLAPSAYEAGFLSIAHTDEDINPNPNEVSEYKWLSKDDFNIFCSWNLWWSYSGWCGFTDGFNSFAFWF